MRAATIAAMLLLASTRAGSAETCQETFVRLLVDGNGPGPVKIHVTQEIKGGATSTNHFYQTTVGHWMTEMIEPANQDWVLTHDNVLYTSSDKGKSWRKIRAVDSARTDAEGKKNRQTNAETTRNARCGAEELDGVAFDTVEAEFDTLQNFKTRNHYKYWVNRETGFIAKAEYTTKATGFESFVTQLLEPAPGLTLPTPE